MYGFCINKRKLYSSAQYEIWWFMLKIAERDLVVYYKNIWLKFFFNILYIKNIQIYQ